MSLDFLPPIETLEARVRTISEEHFVHEGSSFIDYTSSALFALRTHAAQKSPSGEHDAYYRLAKGFETYLDLLDRHEHFRVREVEFPKAQSLFPEASYLLTGDCPYHEWFHHYALERLRDAA